MRILINLKMFAGLIKLDGQIDIQITGEKFLMGLFGTPIRNKIIKEIQLGLEKAKKFHPQGQVTLDGEKIN